MRKFVRPKKGQYIFPIENTNNFKCFNCMHKKFSEVAIEFPKGNLNGVICKDCSTLHVLVKDFEEYKKDKP